MFTIQATWCVYMFWMIDLDEWNTALAGAMCQQLQTLYNSYMQEKCFVIKTCQVALLLKIHCWKRGNISSLDFLNRGSS